jgi:transposase-like protein
MGKQRRKFEVGFKQQIVAEVESSLLSVSAASRKHQISGSVIDRRRHKARQDTLKGSPSSREKALERENRELKEKLAELYLENAQLKNSRTGYDNREAPLPRGSLREFGSIAQGLKS